MFIYHNLLHALKAVVLINGYPKVSVTYILDSEHIFCRAM